MNTKYLQYFTDPEVVRLALVRLRRHRFHNVIDPAMGEGAFLGQALHLWPKIKLFGIDLDRNLVQKMRAIFRNAGQFITGDSLLDETFQKGRISKILRRGGFDLVVGNPPFSRQRISDQSLLKRFRISHLSRDGDYTSQTCEVLFIEQFVRLCRVGGYIVIVVPNGILCNARDLRVRKFLMEHTEVQEAISVPSQIFNGTDASTAVLILRKKDDKRTARALGPVLLHKLDRTTSGLSLNGKVLVTQDAILERMDYDFYNPVVVAATRPDSVDLKTKKLGGLIRYIAAGRTLYGRRRRFSRQGGLRYISSKTVTFTGLDYCKELRFVRRGSPMDSPRSHTKSHDMLFVRVGEGCLGRVTVVRKRRDLGTANDCVWIIRTKVVSPYYIALILQTELGRKLIERGKQKSTGAESISKKSFLGFDIPILDRKIRKRVIKRYKTQVLDLHSDAVVQGLRGNRAAYLRRISRAQANLQAILRTLNQVIAGNRFVPKLPDNGESGYTRPQDGGPRSPDKRSLRG